jgi:hypothetical protein
MQQAKNGPARQAWQRYLKMAQALDGWIKMEDFARIAAGRNRFHQADSVVGWLARSNRLHWQKYHRRKVYIVPRLAKGQFFSDGRNIAHSLGSTDVRVRIAISDREAQIISERYFRINRLLGIIPDGGFLFPNGWVLLYEFCTQDNSQRLNVLRWKVHQYQRILEDKRQYQVLFVLDIPSERVMETVRKLSHHSAIFYIDYATFQRVPFGQQLSAAIYLNGSSGQLYPLQVHEI